MSENTKLIKIEPGKLAIFGDRKVNDKFTAGIKGGEYLPKISITGREFAMVVSGERKILPKDKGRYELNVVIVDARASVSKQFYKKKWGEKDQEKSAPDCLSLDGVTPDANVPSKQSDTCQLCPHNAWGSADNGKGKRCQDYKLLIVLPAGKLDGQPFQLSLPPASLKSFKSYCRTLDTHGIPVNGAITTLSFLEGVTHPQLEFAFADTLASQEEYEQVLAAAERQDVKDVLQSIAAPREQHPAEQQAVIPITKTEVQTDGVITGDAKPKKPRAKKVVEPDPEPAKQEDAGEESEVEAIMNAWISSGK